MPYYFGLRPAEIGDDGTGRSARISPTRTLQTSPMVRLVGSTMHNTTKDTVFWSETVAVSGSVTQGNGHAVLTTGTGANSSALYQTVRIARYIAGSANLLRAVVRLPDLGSDGNLNVRRWGAFTTTDGFFFQLSGSTFQVGTRIASADTLVANGSFNGECGVTCPMLNTSVHTWEIEYTNSAAWFLVDGRLLHKVAGSSAPNCATMSLPAAVQNVNSAGGVANVSLQVRTCSILRLGEQRTDPRYFHAEALTGSAEGRCWPAAQACHQLEGRFVESSCAIRWSVSCQPDHCEHRFDRRSGDIGLPGSVPDGSVLRVTVWFDVC
jgi:hypothetical protein